MKRKRKLFDDSSDDFSDDSSDDDNLQPMQIQQKTQSHSPPDSQLPGDMQQPPRKRPIVLQERKTIPSKTRNDVNIAELTAIQRRLRELQLEKERQFMREARLKYFEKKKEEKQSSSDM